MGLLKGKHAYRKFSGTCTQCGRCTGSCPSLIKAGMTLGDIARTLLALDRAAGDDTASLCQAIGENTALVQAVRGCFFCTSCKSTCFAHNDVCDLVYNARADFQQLGLIPREAWSSVQVDKEWDIFTAYRAIYGIGYPDLTRHIANDYHEAQSDCSVAFFPGCSLAAYGPELTREIFATVEDLGGKTTLVDYCCGSPLKSAGFTERAEALVQRIADELELSGASLLVCVCPGCANALEAVVAARGIAMDVVSLAGFLAERGFTAQTALPEGDLLLSKSCQDRDGSCLRETCAVLDLDADVPKLFHGCCGAGGAVSAFQPARQDAQADSKLSFAPEGSCVVTVCPTCTYTYAARLLARPRDIRNKHYAELLFQSQFDWDGVFDRLNSMWTGEYGPWLAQVFA